MIQSLGEERPYPAHLVFAHAAGGDGGSANADATRAEGLARVVGDGVVVADDPRPVQRLGGLLSDDLFVREVHQDQMGVGAAGDEVEAPLQELRRQHLGVEYDLVTVLAKGGGRRLGQGHAYGGGSVVVRPALQGREYSAVDALREVRPAEDHSAARPSQRLVGGRRDDVGVRDRVRVSAGHDEPGDVRDVGEEVGAHFSGDFTERLEVELARVRRGSRDDDLGLFATR